MRYSKKNKIIYQMVLLSASLTSRMRKSLAFTCSTINPKSSQPLSFMRSFHQTTALHLNRFLFDPSEMDTESGIPTVILPKNDYRTVSIVDGRTKGTTDLFILILEH